MIFGNFNLPAPQPVAGQPARFTVPVPFYQGQQVGLGDAVHQVTDAMGIEQCSPCKARQEALNRWLQFRGWQT
jgi:hypothetical protein